MELNKIIINSDRSQFKKMNNAQYQTNYPTIPFSTLIGMLRVIFGHDIDNFIFGFKFEYEEIEKELFNVYKQNRKFNMQKKDMGVIENIEPCIRELYVNPKLIIYTDLSEDNIIMEHCLTIGRSNNLADIKFPFQKINLIEKEGQAINQYSPINMGNGIIMPIAIENKYNKLIDLFDTTITTVRFNKELQYNKFYDEDIEENIVLWKYSKGALKCL